MRRLRCSIASLVLVAGVLAIPATSASAAGWLTPESVSLSASDLGFDSAGNAVAVGPGADGLRAATRQFGGSWLSASTVAVSGDSQVRSPHVAVDSDGDAVAVWSAKDAGAVRVVRVSSRPAGGVWSSPQQLTVGAAKDGTDSYAVTLDDQGQATVAWIENVGGTLTVRAARSPFDRDWNAAERTTLSDGTAEEHADALQLAGAPGGRVVAAWIQRKNLVAKLQSRRVVTGSWTETPDTLDTAENIAAPRIAANDHGDATAVWTRGGDVRSSRRTAIGDWTPASNVAPGREPDVAVDSHGTATAVWATGPAGTQVVWTSRRAGGSNTWSEPQPLASSSPAGNVSSPQVAVDPQRNATVIWARNVSENFTAEASRRPVEGDWSSPVGLPLGAISLDANARPVGGLDPRGHATLLWSGAPAPGSSSILDPIAPELRDLTVPATGVAGQPLSVSVDPFDISTVEVAWSFDDGGSASGATSTHTFVTSGEHTVTVTGVDAAGNESAETRTITIAAAPDQGSGPGTDPGPGPDPKPDPKPDPRTDPGPGPTPLIAPVLSSLRQTSTRWTLRKRRGSRVPVGTSFRFRLDRNAQVRLSFDQLVAGRRSGKRCVTATKKNGAKRACDRVVRRGTVTAAGKAGANGVEFRGKVGKRTLKPGRYRVRVTATADGKTSKSVTKTFTIVR